MIWPFNNRQPGGFSFERLDLSHTHAIADIHAKTFVPAWSDGDFQTFLNNNNVRGFALRDLQTKGGAVVGFVLARVIADEAEILTVAVEPARQGQGIGRNLMDRLIGELLIDGVSSLFLEVNETNKSAIALYKRLGFTQVAMRENYYRIATGEKFNALVMRRDLN